MKNDSPAAFVEIPVFGDDGCGLEIFVEFGEADHKVGDHVKRNVIGGEGPVQTRRLGAQINPEIVVGDPLRRFTGAFASGASHAHKQPERNNESKRFAAI
jgi:hypothetical protein